MDVIELMSALLTAEDEGSAPPMVTAEDAIAISAHFHGQADRGAEALQGVARKLNVTIACHQGCNGCCHDPLLVRGPEAVAVAGWLAQPEHAAARKTFLAAYPAWRSAVGDAPERLARLLRTGTPAAYEAEHRLEKRKAVLCAFNHEGSCLIYEVRPMVCRTTHAVGTSEHCQPGDTSGVPPTRITFVPIDNLVALSRRVMRAAEQVALGAAAGHEALCKTVAAALAARPDDPEAPQAPQAPAAS